MNFRMERVNLEIKNALSAAISQMDDKRISSFFITIAEVRTSPDLSLSKVSISFLTGTETEHKEIIRVLNSSKGYLKKQLTTKIKIRRTPDIFFVEDKTDEKATRIDEILAQIAKKTQQ